MQQARQNLRVQFWVTVLGTLLFILKITAYYYTHSLSILTDALESIVNVIAGFIGLYSLYIAAKPGDKEHPYGHGKAEFISAAIEGALIVAAGVLVIYETVVNILNKETPARLDTGILLVGITAIVNYIAGSICIKTGNKNKSLALQASGKHLQTDTYSTLAIIAGLVLIYFTHLVWLDKLVAFAMSLFIMYNGYTIIRSSLAGIMDEADMQLLADFIALLNKNRQENWVDLHNLRVIKYGAHLHVDCHLTVPWYLNVHEAHTAVEALNKLIKEEFGQSIELFVHTDGCMPFSCSICAKADCTQRQSAFQQKINWDIDNVLSDKKHQMHPSV